MTRRKNKNKWLCWLVLVMFVGVGIFVTYRLMHNDEMEEIDDDETIVEIIEEGQSDEEGVDEPVIEVDGKEEIKQYDGEDPNEKTELSGVVTYASVNNGKLMIRVNIDQYLESGTCTLTLKRGGATIYNSIARIIGGASTATCEGFDVSTDELGTGEVEIYIDLSAGGLTGTIRGKADI